MWHRVDVVLTDVSKERIASIFRVEGKIRKFAGEETVRNGASFVCGFAYFSFYPEDGGGTFLKTSVNTTSTRCNIPEDCFLHSHRRENLKFYMSIFD
jgi:hypothetical protein